MSEQRDLKGVLREQILWARLKLCEAQKAEVWSDECAWEGYLNALHWAGEFLLGVEPVKEASDDRTTETAQAHQRSRAD